MQITLLGAALTGPSRSEIAAQIGGYCTLLPRPQRRRIQVHIEPSARDLILSVLSRSVTATVFRTRSDPPRLSALKQLDWLGSPTTGLLRAGISLACLSRAGLRVTGSTAVCHGSES